MFGGQRTLSGEIMTEMEIIDRYRGARDHLKQQYPDTWYQTGFLHDIKPVIADTYYEWQQAGLSDEAWWNQFVLSDLVFCLWAPTHIQHLYMERDFPVIAGEGSV